VTLLQLLPNTTSTTSNWYYYITNQLQTSTLSTKKKKTSNFYIRSIKQRITFFHSYYLVWRSLLFGRKQITIGVLLHWTKKLSAILYNSPKVQPVLLDDKLTEAINIQEYQLGRYSGTWFIFYISYVASSCIILMYILPFSYNMTK
jgi:hypothetical protein